VDSLSESLLLIRNILNLQVHNESTGHNYAIEMATQRVWDYAGDCYVHRLVQNKVDGKMIATDDPGASEETAKVNRSGSAVNSSSDCLLLITT